MQSTKLLNTSENLVEIWWTVLCFPETLMPALEEFEDIFLKFKDDADFQEELNYYLKNYVGREAPLYTLLSASQITTVKPKFILNVKI